MSEQLKDNLSEVRQKIADAAKRSGRTADDVLLVGVSKYVDAQATRWLVEAGCDVLGESRPQQLWDKFEQLQDLDIQWHLIGHLQRNKAKRTVPCVAMIESVDSLRLLKAIDAASIEVGRVTPILLEVNVSGEEAKHGFSAASITDAIAAASDLRGIQVRGMMAMAGLDGTSDQTRQEFASLRQLRDKLRDAGLPDRVGLDELSIGMSGDYEMAIEEGATIVRVGSALWRGLR